MRLNPKAKLGVAGMALPVSYLVYKHVSWESSLQSKKRMLTHQVTFWGMLGVGLMLMHRAFFKSGISGLGRAWRVGLAGLIAAPAFEVGERLGEKLFPHQQKQSATPTSRYTPSYAPALKSLNAVG